MTTNEKGVFIQMQNTVVSSKTLVLVNCLNPFVHDCRHQLRKPQLLQNTAACFTLVHLWLNFSSLASDFLTYSVSLTFAGLRSS